MTEGEAMEPDVRALQLRELEILKAVAKVCDDNGLRYFAVYGTLLGAVRHQGFIPWDDDVDIGMPRKDYERFRQIAPQVLPEHLRVMDYDRNPLMTQFYIKVQDTRTTFVETYWADFPEMHEGVFIDIFPLDGYPEKRIGKKLADARRAVLWRINWAIRVPEEKIGELDVLRRFVVRTLRRMLPVTWASSRTDRFLSKYDQNYSATAICGARWVAPAECFRTVIQMPFEDMLLPCPEGHDKYLTFVYGNYMTPPPEAERVSIHPSAYISLEKSYLDCWWEKEKKQ